MECSVTPPVAAEDTIGSSCETLDTGLIFPYSVMKSGYIYILSGLTIFPIWKACYANHEMQNNLSSFFYFDKVLSVEWVLVSFKIDQDKNARFLLSS